MARNCFLLPIATLLVVTTTMAMPTKTTNLSTDKSSLNALKSHVTSDPKNILRNGWSDSTFVCDWTGVTCGGDPPRVVGLDLAFAGLVGTVPPHLGNLTSLVDLRLRNNTFRGVLPYELSRLRQLKNVSFGFNGLTGELPWWLGLLPRLERMSFYGNKFSGSIPASIFSSTSLQTIDLKFNLFSGPLPLSLFNMSSLKIIDLCGNRFNDILPDNICQNLPVIQEIYLGGNQLGGPLPSKLWLCKDLRVLSLLFNNFRGNIPKSVGNLTKLRELYLGDNRLTVPPCKDASRKDNKALVLRFVTPAFIVVLVTVVLLMILPCWRKRNINPGSEVTLVNWRRVTRFELIAGTNGFKEENLLGMGSFGSVFKGTLSDGLVVAVKVFNLALEEAFTSFDKECEVLCNIRHRNLVKVITCCDSPDFKALVLEYMPKGSLEKWLHSDGLFLNILQRLNVVIDVASALEYLHYRFSSTIVHCDLKPGNVLLDEDMVAHLADFGIAKLLCGEVSITRTMTLATIGYMAPEYGVGGVVSRKGDVYSFGIMLMEVFTKKKPIDEMFFEEMNIKQWVENSLPHSITEVVDADLLRSLEERRYRTDIDCVSSLLELALTCSASLAEERLDMKGVVIALNKIKMNFLRNDD